jgi:hypothetical protein
MLFSFIVGNLKLVLPILFFSVILAIICADRGMLERIVKSSKVGFNRSNSIVGYFLVFSILPISIIIQRHFPAIFDFYSIFLNFHYSTTESNLTEGYRVTGLLAAEGTGGSSILASIFILGCELSRHAKIKESAKLGYFLYLSIIYVWSTASVGTAGLFLMFAYIFVRFCFFSKGQIVSVFIFLSGFGVLLAVKAKDMTALTYFSALANLPFSEFLEYRSVGVLMSMYVNAEYLLGVALSDGGLFGNPTATGYYQLLDIGLINGIHVLGQVTYGAFLFWLVYDILFKVKDILLSQSNDPQSTLVLLIISLYSLVIQSKELVIFGAPSLTLLILLSVLVNLKATDSNTLVSRKIR